MMLPQAVAAYANQLIFFVAHQNKRCKKLAKALKMEVCRSGFYQNQKGDFFKPIEHITAN